jgi:hypothetical protein
MQPTGKKMQEYERQRITQKADKEEVSITRSLETAAEEVL